MEQKTLKMKDILIALAITAVIAIIAISIQNGIKNNILVRLFNYNS